MADDELKEINGIKPNVWLGDGEEREVSSQSRCAKLKLFQLGCMLETRRVFLATLFIKLNVPGIITIGKYLIIPFRDTENERERCPVHAQ